MSKFCTEKSISQLPDHVCQSIVEYASTYVDRNTPNESYGAFEKNDKQSIVYTPNIKTYLREHGIPRPVIVAALPAPISDSIRDFFEYDPKLRDLEWKVQIIRGGSFVAPHIDVVDVATTNIVYMIQTGGAPVTTWWKLRNEYESAHVPSARVVPFDVIEPVEQHSLQPHKWYELDVSTIHSVGIQESDRIALSARVTR